MGLNACTTAVSEAKKGTDPKTHAYVSRAVIDEQRKVDAALRPCDSGRHRDPSSSAALFTPTTGFSHRIRVRRKSRARQPAPASRLTGIPRPLQQRQFCAATAASVPPSPLNSSLECSAAMPEMAQRGESLTTSSMNRSSAVPAAEDDEVGRDPHIPGSIPPWVHISSDEGDTLIPPPARPNTRHYRPPPSHYKPGRKWDHIRSAEPPLMSAPIADHQTRWIPFMQSGPHPPWHEQGARLMSPEWMEENVPITVRGWEEEDEALADKQEELKGFWLLSPEKRERTVRLFWVSHTGGFAPSPSYCLGPNALRRARRVCRDRALPSHPPVSVGDAAAERSAQKWSAWRTRHIIVRRLPTIIDLAALAHMGERQTEVTLHVKTSILCGIWRYCVRSTEAASLIFCLFVFPFALALFYTLSSGLD